MICCEKSDVLNCFEIIKRYDPKPKNPDGSIRKFLSRWDDGKDGYRQLARCKYCGTYFLIQCYKLSKFADSSGKLYEDWYVTENEAAADEMNEQYNGLQLERTFKPVLRRIGEKQEISNV